MRGGNVIKVKESMSETGLSFFYLSVAVGAHFVLLGDTAPDFSGRKDQPFMFGSKQVVCCDNRNKPLFRTCSKTQKNRRLAPKRLVTAGWRQSG